MSYLIYTDSKNLIKSIERGLVRVPAGQGKQFNLYCLKMGDIIFLLDYEKAMVYGPFYVCCEGAKSEKNPRRGPFNGRGNSTGHYRYISIEVDCSRIFTQGVSASEVDINPSIVEFELEDSHTKRIMQKLMVENKPGVPLVIQVNLRGEYLDAMVIEVDTGTCIEHFSFKLNPSIYTLIDRKKREGEYFLIKDEKEGFLGILKEIGSLVYKHILKNLCLERLFEKGGYRIDLVGDERVGRIPFEIAYNKWFLFEKNVFAYRSEKGRNPDNVSVKNVLVIADPSESFHGAYTEGIKIYKFFCELGVCVDFISRPIEKGSLVEMLQGYDLVHYSGHSPEGGEKGGLDLGDSFLRVEDIIPDENLPHLIFISACSSTMKMGIELLNRGIKNVILSRWKIPDHDCSEFILNFYQNLFDRIPSGYSYNLSLMNSYNRQNSLPLAFLFMGESRLVYERQNS